MGGDDDAVSAAVGVGLVVVLRRKSRDRLEQLFGEDLALARRTQADLYVGGECRQGMPAFSAMACASPTSCATREARAIK